MRIRPYIVLTLLFLALVGCDPLTVQTTKVVVIVTAVPSETPVPTSIPEALTPPPLVGLTPSPLPANADTPNPNVTPTLLPQPGTTVTGDDSTPVETTADAGTPEATDTSCGEDSGQIIKIDKFPSKVAHGENLRYHVYVPPCYLTTQKRYPYVILIHGASYKETQWETLGITAALDQGLRLGALPPMILVMPYFGNIGAQNTFPPDPSYETVILDELMPAIQRDFCTVNDRQHRAIGGISRGGFWAYSIALRHPDVFGIVGGHSAFFPDDGSVPAAFSPLDLALNSTFLTDAGLRMYLDNGAQDSAGPSQQLFSSRLSSRGIAHTYVINPVGEHNDDYWSAHVSEYLAFYGRTWDRHVSDLPSCLQPSP